MASAIDPDVLPRLERNRAAVDFPRRGWRARASAPSRGASAGRPANSPREYVQRVRVEAAKRALEGGDGSVAEVAARVGYGDPAAFRKLFAQQTGLPPSEHRARYGARVEPTWITRTSAARRSRATAR